MNELVKVRYELEQGMYVVGMEVDDVAYVLFSSVHEHEAEGVAALVRKAVNHLLVIEEDFEEAMMQEAELTKAN